MSDRDFLRDGEVVWESELENEFREQLNELYDPYKIGIFEFYAGDILKEMDPIAFREDFLNWLDAEGIEEA